MRSESSNPSKGELPRGAANSVGHLCNSLNNLQVVLEGVAFEATHVLAHVALCRIAHQMEGS